MEKSYEQETLQCGKTIQTGDLFRIQEYIDAFEEDYTGHTFEIIDIRRKKNSPYPKIEIKVLFLDETYDVSKLFLNRCWRKDKLLEV